VKTAPILSPLQPKLVEVVSPSQELAKMPFRHEVYHAFAVQERTANLFLPVQETGTTYIAFEHKKVLTVHKQGLPFKKSRQNRR
jgi:hypothetical protein